METQATGAGRGSAKRKTQPCDSSDSESERATSPRESTTKRKKIWNEGQPGVEQ